MITLRFSAHNSIGSHLIRWFTWSQYSHVDIVLPDGRLLGARSSGGVSIQDDDGRATKVLTARIDAPDSVIDMAMTQLGKPYDYGAIFGFPLRQPLQDNRAWFCSELVTWAFQAAGHPLLHAENLSRITPRDVLLSPLLTECE